MPHLQFKVLCLNLNTVNEVIWYTLRSGLLKHQPETFVNRVIVCLVFKVFHEGHSAGTDEARLHSHQADQSSDTGPGGKAGGGN